METHLTSYCGYCGEPDGPTADDAHRACRGQLELEPPRYCAACRRKMKVQVVPTGWVATCSRHGSIQA